MKKNMKNDFFRKGIEGIRNIQLSPEERGVVLSRLLEHAEKHSAVVSPWKIYLSRFQVKYAIVGVLIVLFGGGGAASAAEGALPGDILYPVKIYVNEPLRKTLIAGDVPKAQFEAERTVRRLEEAESLAAQGRLNKASAETVREHFEKSAATFDSVVQKLEAKGSSKEAVNVRVDFEAQINAHSQILSTVGSAMDVSRDNDITPLRDAVEEKAQKAKESRANAVGVFLKDFHEEFDGRAQSIQAIIQKTGDRFRNTVSATAASSSVQNVILETIPQTLQAAENALRDAKEKENSGDSNEAFSVLLDSESAAKEADISLKQGLKFGKEEKKGKRDSSRRGDGDSDREDNSGRGGN